MNNSVVGIIFSNDKKKVVAIKRCDVPIWVFPGGGIEQGETPESAIVREILEETGLEVSVSRKIGEYTPINRLTLFTHLFECKIKGGALRKGEETRDVGLFDYERLPPPFLPVHEHWLNDALLESEVLIKRPITGTSWGCFFKYLILHPVLMFRYIMTLIGFTINTKEDTEND